MCRIMKRFFCRSIVDIVESLQQNITDVIFEMVVRRSNVLSDTLRIMEKASFDPTKRLMVR